VGSNIGESCLLAQICTERLVGCRKSKLVVDYS